MTASSLAMTSRSSQQTASTSRLVAIALILLSNSDFGSAFTSTFTASTYRSNTPLRNPCQNNNVRSEDEAEGRNIILHDYLPEPTAGPIADACRFTEDQIHLLLYKRQECKHRRQFAEADKILVGLNQNGVYVHDKRREWRADGHKHFGRNAQYVRRGGTYGLSEEDVVAISRIVEDRSYAKKRKEFHISDELTNILKTKYKVKVNDKNREWSVVVSNWDGMKAGAAGDSIGMMHYVPSPLAPAEDPTHTMDAASKDLIAQRLADRVAFRKKKDYRTADKIRDELMEQYSIVIDDRTREWKVVLGDIEDDDFARKAQLSQRSAFVRRGNDKQPVKSVQHAVSDETNSTSSEGGGGGEERAEKIDLESLTVVELKEQLRQAGLPVSGKKADLIARLNS